jgi:hypothetical protein
MAHWFWQTHIDAVFALFNRKRLDAVVEAGGLAGQGIIIPAMLGAT